MRKASSQGSLTVRRFHCSGGTTARATPRLQSREPLVKNTSCCMLYASEVVPQANAQNFFDMLPFLPSLPLGKVMAAACMDERSAGGNNRSE